MTDASSDVSREPERSISGLAPWAVPPDDDRGLWLAYRDSLKGPRAPLVKIALVKGAAFVAIGVYCVVQAFLSSDVRAVVLWALGAMWSIVVVTSVKLWWWMEINRMSIVRCLHRAATEPTRDPPAPQRQAE